jgi:hypothetical protein
LERIQREKEQEGQQRRQESRAEGALCFSETREDRAPATARLPTSQE